MNRLASSSPESNADIRLWLPQGDGIGVRLDSAVWLRVPCPGSLQDLEARFRAFQGRLNAAKEGFARPVSAPALHRTVAYAPSDDAPRTSMLALRLADPFDRTKAARFHPEDAVVVGGMLRHAAMRMAEQFAPALSDFAAGYGPEQDADRRLSWVPLPSVGHRHADGGIRRGLLMARGCDIQLLSQLAQHIPPDGISMVDEATGECVALAAPLAAGEEAALQHYTAAACSWISVTPVILPGDYGAGDLRVMTKLMHKAIREAGIDPGLVAGLEFSKSGFSRQAVNLGAVRLKDWKAKHLILYHVRLRFKTPVRGPVVLGRGRHYGLGLFSANGE